jgi:hypothetical protein
MPLNQIPFMLFRHWVDSKRHLTRLAGRLRISQRFAMEPAHPINPVHSPESYPAGQIVLGCTVRTLHN